MPRPRRLHQPVVYPYDTPPRKGDYGLTAGSSLAMFVTRLGTFSRYGHACVVLEDPIGDRIKIIEAMDGRTVQGIALHRRPPKTGARIRTARLDEFRWSNLVLTEEQRDTIAAAAARTEGVPYDWPAILGFVAQVWGYKLKLLGHNDKPDDKMICSELVVWAYLVAGIDLGQGKAPGQVSPGDLGDYLVSH